MTADLLKDFSKHTKMQKTQQITQSMNGPILSWKLEPEQSSRSNNPCGWWWHYLHMELLWHDTHGKWSSPRKSPSHSQQVAPVCTPYIATGGSNILFAKLVDDFILYGCCFWVSGHRENWDAGGKGIITSTPDGLTYGFTPVTYKMWSLYLSSFSCRILKYKYRIFSNTPHQWISHPPPFLKK